MTRFTAANYYYFLASGGAPDLRYEAEGRAKEAADKARETAAKGKAMVQSSPLHLCTGHVKQLQTKLKKETRG